MQKSGTKQQYLVQSFQDKINNVAYLPRFHAPVTIIVLDAIEVFVNDLQAARETATQQLPDHVQIIIGTRMLITLLYKVFYP